MENKRMYYCNNLWYMEDNMDEELKMLLKDINIDEDENNKQKRRTLWQYILYLLGFCKD